uniref:SGNH hydrolase-type esterase domain-containing protein n=1 Tax=Kalanchoe fedtschenkoi TaxID=63787 RepID=A0A7N0SWM2_KALFE
MTRPRIYLFGDSITEASYVGGGWGAALTYHFARTADVVLRGYSGYNTRWALKVVERVFPDDGVSPIAVTVFFGANDACLPDRCSAFQHVPIAEYKENLQAIVSFFKKRWPATQVLLLTPPPIDDEVRLQYPYIENPANLPERTNQHAGLYARAAVEVAEETGVPVIDFWTIMQQTPDWKTYLSDGLHLSPSGNTVVFDQVIKKLGEAGLSLDALPVDLPLIAEIDTKDPLKAFEFLQK